MLRKSSFHDYVMNELFVNIEGIRSRPMFGGWGIYKQSLRPPGLKDDIFFALISNGQLFFKVGDTNREDFETHGSKPFVYTGHKDKNVTMSYWELPVDIMDDHELIKWIDKSVLAAKAKK